MTSIFKKIFEFSFLKKGSFEKRTKQSQICLVIRLNFFQIFVGMISKFELILKKIEIRSGCEGQKSEKPKKVKSYIKIVKKYFFKNMSKKYVYIAINIQNLVKIGKWEVFKKNT